MKKIMLFFAIFTASHSFAATTYDVCNERAEHFLINVTDADENSGTVNLVDGQFNFTSKVDAATEELLLSSKVRLITEDNLLKGTGFVNKESLQNLYIIVGESQTTYAVVHGARGRWFLYGSSAQCQ
jgi:hypothetical protein